MNAHFLHIRKTGGKSIMAALAPLAGAGAYTLRLHSHDWSLSDVPVGEKVFFTVRDPITRFVSGFYARFREGRLQFGDGVFKPHIACYYDRFPTARDLARALDDSDQETRDFAHEAMRTLDHINTSYADWFSDPAYFASRRDDIVCVMRQERLADDFVVLRDRLGLSTAALPAVNVGDIRNPGGLDRELDERARSNLATWYADDFAYLELVDEIDPR